MTNIHLSRPLFNISAASQYPNPGLNIPAGVNYPDKKVPIPDTLGYTPGYVPDSSFVFLGEVTDRGDEGLAEEERTAK